MPRHERSVLAVVPARGGSKGIPRKNLCEIGGLSLVAHAARIANALPWLDARVLTTDDPEIAEEGRRFGLAVPFMRPAELASDRATGVAAWCHAWMETEAALGRTFDCSILLQPTSPLREKADVERTFDAMIAGQHQAATTVSRVPGHYAPEKLLAFGEGRLSFLHPDGAAHSNRQGIPVYYARNGLCYAAMREAILERQEIIETDCAAVIIDRYVANIDEPIDLEIARFLAGKMV